MIKLSNGMIFNEAEILLVVPRNCQRYENSLIKNDSNMWRVYLIGGMWIELNAEEKAELEKGMGNETP